MIVRGSGLRGAGLLRTPVRDTFSGTVSLLAVSPKPEMQMMSYLQGPAGATDPGTDPITLPTDLESATDLLGRAQAWLVDEGPGIGMRFVAAIAIFVIGRWMARFCTSAVRRIMQSRGLDKTLIGFVGSLLYALLLTFVVIAMLGHLGIDTTGFAAILAAGSFAIGFALQGSLGNFAAGVMMMIFRPIKQGDYIEAGGMSGTVEAIGVFSTTMKTGDNKRIIVPNSGIIGSNITNYSSNDTRRIDFVFGIGHDDDILQAKKLLETILSEDDRILEDPEPLIGVLELAKSSVKLACRPWVQTSDYWGVRFRILEQVKLRFDAAGISILFT